MLVGKAGLKLQPMDCEELEAIRSVRVRLGRGSQEVVVREAERIGGVGVQPSQLPAEGLPISERWGCRSQVFQQQEIGAGQQRRWEPRPAFYSQRPQPFYLAPEHRLRGVGILLKKEGRTA